MAAPLTLAAGAGTVSGYAAEGEQGAPLLVCLPGGGYNARYFDVPAYSLADAALRRGFSVALLDRPGYAGSTPLPHPTFAGNAQVLTEAIAGLWDRWQGRSSGVVLAGHSMGGAIAFHMAAGPLPWPLLGVAATGIHDDTPESVAQAWNSLPASGELELPDDQRLQLLYGPEGTYDPAVVAAAAPAVSPVPVAELREVVGGWVRDARLLVTRITVPVHYALTEFEHLWVTGQDSVASFAAAFSASAKVTSRYVLGSGHNVDHHLVGPAYHQEQLDWAQKLDRAGAPG